MIRSLEDCRAASFLKVSRGESLTPMLSSALSTWTRPSAFRYCLQGLWSTMRSGSHEDLSRCTGWKPRQPLPLERLDTPPLSGPALPECIPHPTTNLGHQDSFS